MNRYLPGVACDVLLVSCFAANGPARAQGADIKTIVSVNGPPVVVNQSSSLNMVGIFHDWRQHQRDRHPERNATMPRESCSSVAQRRHRSGRPG